MLIKNGEVGTINCNFRNRKVSVRGGEEFEGTNERISNHIRKAGDSKKFSGLLFIDFQKAFDMINHEVLLHRLSNLGIRHQNLEWFKSYFQNRQIAVRNGQSISEFKPVTRGTPQGSSLSGLLFSIYINLVTGVFKHCKAIFYADDLILWFSSDSVEEIQSNLQLDINKLCEWCDLNYMKINVAKTKILLITPPRKPTMELLIKIEMNKLQQVTEFKYLGVLIDEKMNWNSQYDEVCKKMSERVFLINRQKNNESALATSHHISPSALSA
jgi:hypothetical protein